MAKVLKYQKYLDKYKNCPSEKCIERDFECYRWVHSPETQNDFEPQVLMNPPRIFDKKDLLCENFCLSVYKDLKSAINRFNYICSRSKEDRAEIFKKQVGEYTAKLILSKDDGLADFPDTKTGHFSFHQYEDCKILEKIKRIFDNFA